MHHLSIKTKWHTAVHSRVLVDSSHASPTRQANGEPAPRLYGLVGQLLHQRAQLLRHLLLAGHHFPHRLGRCTAHPRLRAGLSWCWGRCVTFSLSRSYSEFRFRKFLETFLLFTLFARPHRLWLCLHLFYLNMVLGSFHFFFHT